MSEASMVDLTVDVPAWMADDLDRLIEISGLTADAVAAFLFSREVVHTSSRA